MPETAEYITIATFVIKVDGQAIDAALQDNIVQLLVDSNLQLPDMACLQLYSDTPKIVDAETFAVGKSLEISVADSQQLFKGEISAIEPEFNAEGYVTLEIRGYDKSHRLHRGKKTRVFTEMKDSDIVSKIAQEAGLTANADATSGTHKHVWQVSQTDMEFLRERAQRNGYHLYYSDDKLNFVKAAAAGSSIKLTWGNELRSFRPRMAITHQVNTVIVRSWDPEQKKAVEGKATAASSTKNQGGETQDGGSAAKKALGSAAETLSVTYPNLTVDDAKTMAQSLLDRIHSLFIQAEGTCVGNPDIKAGTIVEIADVGERFSGTYVVTTATHTFDPENNYETTFHVHGKQAGVLSYLLQGDGNAQSARGLIPGVVPAIVTNTNDEDLKIGRVKVKFPWLDDEVESTWARLSAPGAGATRGLYAIPEVDDEVLVAFEHGDINSPYILGGLWNGKDKPPKATNEVVAGGVVNERIFQSRSGHVIILGDEDGKEHITIRDKTGNNEIVINSKENTITINVDKDYTLVAKGAVSSTSDKTTDIVSKGNLTIKADSGSNVTVEGTNITVKGQGNVKVEATGNLDLKANGQLNLQGAQVAVKGSAMVQIQGALVKIN